MKNRAASIAFIAPTAPNTAFYARTLAVLAFVSIAQHKQIMPTLTRILLLLAVIAAIVYGAMFSLANFVKPVTHEITIEIPTSKLKQTVVAPPPASAPSETVTDGQTDGPDTADKQE